ncbi:hypothetical protein SAMN04487902_11192 [Prevotella sp. ne3005]|uniref:hypothetical protein n=1 Tax=Prevotella sp. ne3005 TaxID=1761887 RepID=UPI0008D5DBEC|nr:hypothetical protein [Prevotella sp. ne3005]SEN31811.1 hypothetical protein SAMN04487902_11192 [Prevotella sp. ne3005]
MKTLNYLLIGFALLTLSSCAFYTQTAPVAGLDPNGIKVNVVADLDMENAKTVTATVKTKKVLWFINLVYNERKYIHSPRYRGFSESEGLALYRAKNEADVDVILDPEFESEKHSWFFGIYKTRTTTLRGLGVNIKGYQKQ